MPQSKSETIGETLYAQGGKRQTNALFSRYLSNLNPPKAKISVVISAPNSCRRCQEELLRLLRLLWRERVDISYSSTAPIPNRIAVNTKNTSNKAPLS